MILAHRARKARHDSACLLCHGPVRVGQYIACLGVIWVHTRCAVARM
jgi:hypothetical protein